MEVQVDRHLIKSERERRAWSQSHLAAVTGLGHRTVQRIEATGNASYESAAAIATVFSLTVAELVPAGTAVWRDRPTRTAIQMAAVVGSVVAAALVLVSLQTPDMGVPASQPAASPAEPVPAVNGDVATASCPAESFGGQGQLNLDIECETVDPDWAPAVERQLRSLALAYLSDRPDLSERFSFTGVRCRTTICEIRFLNSAPTGPIEIRPDARAAHPNDLSRQLWALSYEFYAEPWNTQFDPWMSTLIGSFVDGDSRLYLQRQTSKLARL